MPGLQQKLRQGATVADVGCGNGRALIKMAKIYPESRYVGYDNHPPSIEYAVRNAQEAGVTNKARFVELDVTDGFPEKYDLITTFDVIHDMVNPRRALKAIRNALKPDGTNLLLDFNSSDKLEEEIGPIGTMLYGVSVMFCMTTSLAEGGEGLGTAGFHPKKVRELCLEAEFSSVRRLPLDDPLNILYEIRP